MPVRSLLALTFALAACSEAPPALLTDDDRAAFLDTLDVPESRPFALGFTPWPYDFTDAAQAETYDALAAHGDLVLFHLDTGVPWAEARAGEPFPEHVERQLDRMAREAGRFETVYVSATPQAQDRETLALRWGDDENQPLAAPWDGRAFDHPDVVAAYVAYCRRLIDRLRPDYFAYGIEVNGTMTLDHAGYPAFRELASQVYGALKAGYPDLPIFLTLQTGSFEATWDEQQAVNRDLVALSDLVGMSTYPYWVPGRYAPDAADLSYLPDDWFSQMAAIAPDKPFAITETGYVAQDFRVPGAVSMRGRELWQAQYVDRLLQSAHQLDAAFVVWFVARDYDRGWERLVELGVESDAFLIWRDTGLLDGDGGERLGLAVWDRWLALPRR